MSASNPRTARLPDTDTAGNELRHAARALLCGNDVAALAQAMQALQERAAMLDIDPDAALDEPPGLPGLPPRPRLVSPHQVPRRSIHTALGRATMLHAVAHIEANAIRLALDAAWRFAGMPADYYRDWLRIAAEESHHFLLVAGHLRTLGHDYGDFDAHNGLWEMVAKTRSDVLARMALVPRTLEARGLDATPPMRAKFVQAGDDAAVAILDVILHDEIGHVAVGNRWYRWLCKQRGVDPLAHYAVLAREHGAPVLRPPFNVEARRRAGFTADEIAALPTAEP
jgi:uncharacterized ferritin-like protein (DUF455 family)